MSQELDPTDFEAVISHYNIGSLDRQQEIWDRAMPKEMTDHMFATFVHRRNQKDRSGAIRLHFRRQGFGTAAIHKLCHVARSAGSTELWVYTGCHNDAARSFYLNLRFKLLGTASDYARGRTIDDSDIVQKLQLGAGGGLPIGIEIRQSS